MKLPQSLTQEECQRLRQGGRVVKVAPASDNFDNLKPGETVKSSGCDFKVILRAYREYDSYRQLVLNEGLAAVDPKAKTIGDATKKLRAGKKDEDLEVGSIAAFVLERA